MGAFGRGEEVWDWGGEAFIEVMMELGRLKMYNQIGENIFSLLFNYYLSPVLVSE